MESRHTVTTDTGERIAAVHHEPATQSTDPWLVFCHGFVSDKSGSYEERCRRAVQEGYHAVRFDFRGCGESDGEFVEQTLTSKIADLRTVLDYFTAPAYVLFGSSFGATTAFHTAASDEDHAIRAIAGRAPLTYDRAFEELRAHVERDGEYGYDADHVVDARFVSDFDRYSFGDVTATLDIPVALFHGAADESVPVADTLDATEALDVDVLVQVFADEGHRFSHTAESRMRTQFFDWLAVTGL